VRAPPLPLLSLLAAAALAGCSGGGDGGPGDSLPTLSASPTTGVIRAVVFDEAIRPLAGANVTVLFGGEAVRTGATDAQGFAGFQGLQPGSHLLVVSLRGYLEVRQAVDVVAGEGAPPMAKVLLVRQTADLPFHQEFKFEGFMECAAGGGNWCFIANYYPCLALQAAGQPCTGNLTNDNSYYDLDGPIRGLQRVPDWLQAEMVFESTQAVTPYMTIRLDITHPQNVTIDNATAATGPSPVLVAYPPEWMQDWRLGVDRGLAVEAFPGSPPEVCALDPPVLLNTCSLGVAAEQRFTYLVHAFYGYTPPEGWRFSEAGTVPPPP
jgi:hypothetical protein